MINGTTTLSSILLFVSLMCAATILIVVYADMLLKILHATRFTYICTYTIIGGAFLVWVLYVIKNVIC